MKLHRVYLKHATTHFDFGALSEIVPMLEGTIDVLELEREMQKKVEKIHRFAAETKDSELIEQFIKEEMKDLANLRNKLSENNN